MSKELGPQRESRPLVVGEVIELARSFVSEELADREGFWGAYLTGSINRMDLDTEFPAYLDVDIRVVLESAVREEVDTLLYHGYLLDCNLTPSRAYRSSESILPLPGTACHFVGNHILADAQGRLGRLQEDVAAHFSRREWVERRVASSLTSLEASLTALKGASNAVEALHALGELLLYVSASITVAHLAPPTHRRALANLRPLLEVGPAPELHGRVLSVLGSDRLDDQDVRSLLQYCVDAFDCGLAVKHRAVPFDWMLHPCLRGYLHDGALELIDEGAHREAVFWMLRFFHIAIAAISQDGAADDKILHGARLMQFLAALGLDSAAALEQRVDLCESLAHEVEDYLHRLVSTGA